jgi:flagellar basal body-associated protein FliL
MKYTIDKPSPILIAVQRMLAGILILVFLAILIGTIYVLITKPERKQSEQVPNTMADIQSNDSVFTGIGRIRARSAEPQPAAVMITIAFPYDPNDTSFSEELASKLVQFRNETIQYFQSHTADELRLQSDDELQRELLARYNAFLRLGSIGTLYVIDYMIVE